jgi:hypothetical protein
MSQTEYGICFQKERSEERNETKNAKHTEKREGRWEEIEKDSKGDEERQRQQQQRGGKKGISVSVIQRRQQ